ncbi:MULTISPECIES: LPXTG cell wall anchor domain-containing protein [Staphylococcus]|uniref:LPXTG cell wall anchor domain-containing protein n=1 Tax=Staphylococcus sp. HMSC34C02 TaxID=1608858 RepID=UPI0008A86458|nr:LPXTG cell wall anchor domain-containing protein [Staphylococcus sp. HMSC34C02]OHR84857.1 hypothetical protein HMPREF3239_05660 [Staphylococcus sp. HMSC34C02]
MIIQKKEKALTNFVDENTSSSIEEASENVKNLTIDYNQVDNRALLSVLIKADSNKKDADSYADADLDNSELPETGNKEEKNGVLFGTLIAGVASLVLGRKRNKKNN